MPESRDSDIIRHILRYCNQAETAHADFGYSKTRFYESTTYQNAICMCILQIGELIGKLTDEYRSVHSEIPWHKIRGMRSFVAHEYGKLDLDIVWYTANNNIPELARFCIAYLEKKS